MGKTNPFIDFSFKIIFTKNNMFTKYLDIGKHK